MFVVQRKLNNERYMKIKTKERISNILKLLNLDSENIQLKIVTLSDLNEQLTTQKRRWANDKLLIFINQ